MAKLARIGIYALALLLVLIPASALAQGPTVCGFYGAVTLDGKSVADGTVVSAWIDGAKKAEAKTTTYQGASVYNLNVPGDDTLKDKDIVFKVGDVTAAQKGKYASWANTKLDLAAVTPTPTPSPTPTPTPTPTPPAGDETIPLMIAALALGGALLTCVGVLGYRRVRA